MTTVQQWAEPAAVATEAAIDLAPVAALIILIAIPALFVKKRLKGRPKKNSADGITTPSAPGLTKTQRDELKQEKQEAEEKAKKKSEEKKERLRKIGTQLLLIVIPVFLITANVALGWENLVDFAEKGASIPEESSNFIVVFFTAGAIWSGAVRYRASLKNENTLTFTILIWALLLGESLVQFNHSVFYNAEIGLLGALFLAGLAPVAGLTFEMALAANRSDVRKKNDNEGDRAIPDSYRWSPLLYMQLNHTKANYPDWTTKEIVTHVRVRQTANAERHLHWIQGHESPVVRWLLGERQAIARFRNALIALNPHGRPPVDGRMALAEQLHLVHTAESIVAAGGNRLHILQALGVNTESAREALGLPPVNTPPQVSSEQPGRALPGVSSEQPEGVHRDPSEGVHDTPPQVSTGDSDMNTGGGLDTLPSLSSDDFDRELRSLISGVSSEQPEGVHRDPSEGVHDTPPQVSSEQPPKGRSKVSTEQGKVSTRKPSTKRAKVSTKAPAKRSKITEEQVKAAREMVIKARENRESDPSGRAVMKHVGVGSPLTGGKLLKDAQEYASKKGYVQY